MLFLNEKDLKLIKSIHENTKQEINKSTRNFFGVDSLKRELLYKIIVPYLNPLIGNFTIANALASNSFNPGGIHTDYSEITGNPYYAILIPLETINSHTIVFNEESKENFEIWKLTASKIQNNCSYLHDTLLNHIPKEDLEYLSLNNINKWIEGSLIMWKMTAFHTSDNFIANGLTNKKSVIILTRT